MGWAWVESTTTTSVTEHMLVGPDSTAAAAVLSGLACTARLAVQAKAGQMHTVQ